MMEGRVKHASSCGITWGAPLLGGSGTQAGLRIEEGEVEL